MIEIRLEGITKVFGSGGAAVKAVDEVTARIDSGELFFLLGPSGCGKTTLLRIIAGLIDPTAGRVHFGERDVTDLAVERRNTAMVFQNYALWPHMTVRQNVQFGPKVRGVGATQREEVVAASLQRVEMAPFARRRPNQLSGGQQQRVALARAMAARPEVLLLDEPLSNLDARLRLHMRGELRRLVKSTGTTAVYVTHDQTEALSMADRIAVMDDGRIVQTGTPEELYDRPATHFVADFLGEANFIEGTVKTSNDPVEIETPSGTILAACGFAPGTPVTCCIRPERIRVLSAEGHPPSPNESSLSATVETTTFLGDIRQYTCRLSEQVRWKVTTLAGATPPISVGQKVTLLISSQDVAVLPGSTV